MAESLQNLYAKNLRQSFGYPLRFPEPKLGLPSSYAENGLHIGDVGFVDHRGMFNVLFNICFSLDHALHCARRNDLAGLVGLTKLDPDEVNLIPDGISTGSAICHGIRGPQGDILKDIRGAPCNFKSCSASGAILILPSGAICQDLDENLEKEFRKLAEEHALKWSQFTRRKSLYLITGFYKASSWYLASFHNVAPIEQVLLECNDEGTFTWDSRCDFRQSRKDNSSENQTVFISGFKIEVRDWDQHILVEKLSPHSRSIWLEVALLASYLRGIFLFFLRWIASRSVFRLWACGTPEDMDAGVHINHVSALSQPFHPSDIINRYLLNKNHNAQVAVTHDSEWLSMIEKDELSLEDMMVEERFWAFLEGNYTDHRSSNNVAYIRRIMWVPYFMEGWRGHLACIDNDGPSNKEGNDLRKLMPSPKMFSTAPDGTRQFVITHMRAENIVTCLKRMPIGFYVIIQFNGTRRRSECKPVSLRDSIIEWDNEILLPMDPAIDVQFSIIASFEFEPLLGNGEMLCMLETTVGELGSHGSTYLLSYSGGGEDASYCPSLLITLEERRFGSSAHLDLVNENCKDGSCIEAEVTDEGHKALLCYCRGEGIEKLQESIECFRRALSHCPFNHECRAVALFNHAAASFINARVHGTISDLGVAIHSYRKALVLRPGYHPDRPRTLLHLAQALFVQHGKLHCEAPVVDEIERLTTEIKMICSEDSYEHRAVDLVIPTLMRRWAGASGELPELDEWVSKVERSARMPPDWHFNRSYQLTNLGIALRTCFEITCRLHYLGKSISVTEEALQLAPDGHFDKPWILACLGNALCAHSVQCGNVASLTRSISILEDASKLTPDDHFGKPWTLASLANALLTRFAQLSDVADLDRSIRIVEEAVEHTSDGCFDKPYILTSLGNALRMRFVQLSDVADLDRSIRIIEEAVEHAPDGHFDKPCTLTSLGNTLCVRFARLGDVADLDRSIKIIEEAVEHAPDGHFDKPRMLTSLGNTLRIRFVQRGNVADLDNSITMVEDAVKLTPDGHGDRPWMLACLGDALRIRFLQRGDIDDLAGSISVFEGAVKLTPDGHFDKPRMLTCLGDVLRVRFARGRVLADLKNSISMIEDAVKLTPDGHFDKPWMLVYLRHVLLIRDGVGLRFVVGNGSIGGFTKPTNTSNLPVSSTLYPLFLPPPISINRLPLDILEHIVLNLYDDPTSPPSALLPLLLTSKHFYDALGFRSNSHLYARMFLLCFDVSAPARRLGNLNSPGLSIQLRANYDALRCIRRGNIHADNIVQTFWTCFSMLMENDGKNRRQLDAAGLPDFVDGFIRERLYENSLDDWPAENEVNSLAIWLLWLTSTEERLRVETPAQRAEMTKLILPFVLMPVRYAGYLAPHIHYTDPLPRNLPQAPHPFITVHGPYPQYRNGFSRSMPLYHVDAVPLSIPLASIAAKLIYFSHREIFPVVVPSHLPRTRAHAFQLGHNMVGPTQEDVQELNEHKAAKFVPETTWEWWDEIKGYDELGRDARSKLAPSARWDDDWNRLADCSSVFTPVSLKRVHYTPGLLSGLWQGRMLYTDDQLYGNIMQTSEMPSTFSEQSIGVSAAPVFMRLREYHCMDVGQNQPATSGGIQNAWFQSSARFQEVTHGLSITCQERTSFYDEYIVGGPDLHDESKCRGCQYRGTSEMIFREDDVRYLGELDDVLAEDTEEVDEGEDDAMDDDPTNADDVDMTSSDGGQLVIRRKCNGILDIVFVGETDVRHGQAWHHYKFYGRVREWDGLVALIRVPVYKHPSSATLGTWIFTGYVVAGQNFVGNWRTTALPGEPVTMESAFTMSRRE